MDYRMVCKLYGILGSFEHGVCWSGARLKHISFTIIEKRYANETTV